MTTIFAPDCTILRIWPSKSLTLKGKILLADDASTRMQDLGLDGLAHLDGPNVVRSKEIEGFSVVFDQIGNEGFDVMIRNRGIAEQGIGSSEPPS